MEKKQHKARLKLTTLTQRQQRRTYETRFNFLFHCMCFALIIRTNYTDGFCLVLGQQCQHLIQKSKICQIVWRGRVGTQTLLAVQASERISIKCFTGCINSCINSPCRLPKRIRIVSVWNDLINFCQLISCQSQIPLLQKSHVLIIVSMLCVTVCQCLNMVLCARHESFIN